MIDVLNAKQGIELIHQVNPGFAASIEVAKQSSTLKLIKLSYLYGDKIVDHGEFKLPAQSASETSLAELNIDYSSIPLVLVLKHSCEIFLGKEGRLMPLSVTDPGNFFGLFEVLSWYFNEPKQALWNVTAGARSAFMLASIADRVSHKRLQQRYQFLEEAPQEFLEHSSIFSLINQNASDPWKSEVLVFTKDWFTDPLLKEQFINFIVKLGWNRLQRMRDHGALDYLNEVFVRVIEKKRIPLSPLILDKIKHILMISELATPAFSPAVNNFSLPLDTLQQAYREVYQLKPSSPIIMQPQFLKPGSPTYYFLNFPYFSGVYKGGVTSLVEELKHIKKILLYFLHELKNSADSKIFPNLDQLRYEFFHREASAADNIQAAHCISQLDERWLVNAGNKTFPSNSVALSGCIKISLE